MVTMRSSLPIIYFPHMKHLPNGVAFQAAKRYFAPISKWDHQQLTTSSYGSQIYYRLMPENHSQKLGTTTYFLYTPRRE
ncbi:7b564c85-eb78-4176-9a63-04eaf8edb27d [Sclerotinia trifoliorum]|uniref:7b564c85-eb78-4176-9a63-04eaf8edb27d n=1 Tax=Sclerotinia trifoliorum TaxID=28548 RepID=A0A8H2ZT12_9HELO|nr:7b564c85-eb78-4176-9a63-04eaf8edb27d [Sclerotinia trifoliorum]